jgi:hypothetical protein
VKERLESNMKPTLQADLVGESVTLSGSDNAGYIKKTVQDKILGLSELYFRYIANIFSG